MGINLLYVLILAILIIFFLLICKINKSYDFDNLLMYFTIIPPVVFSSLGIIFEKFQNDEYYLPYIIYICLLFLTTLLLTRSKTDKKESKINNIIDNNKKIFNILGYIALLLQITILIYPNFKLFDIFNPIKINYHFDGSNYFDSRIFLRNDMLSRVLSILRTLTLPFLFILIYNKKDKPMQALLYLIAYYYISYINEYYIQRNKIIMLIVFILLFCIYENIISKKKTIIIVMILIPIITIGSGYLREFRTTGSTKIDINEAIDFTINEEAWTQSLLKEADYISDQVSFSKMIVSIATSPMFFLPDIDFPNISYLFTESITGLKYGDRDYYIILPCSFGEAVIVFGKKLSWIYGVFIGIYISILYNYLKKIKSAKYMTLYVLINYAAAFRGGIYNFILYSLNMTISFTVIVMIVSLFINHNNTKKKINEKGISYEYKNY